MTQNVLLFDKSLNNGLLFYCLNILDYECLSINLDFNTLTPPIEYSLRNPKMFQTFEPFNFRMQGSFIHINSGKSFERDLLSSDSVVKSATQNPWVFWDWNKSSWRYTNLKIKSGFMIGRIWKILGFWVINFPKRQIVANGHL